MAISIDATSNGNTSGNQTSLTVSHTCGAGATKLVVALRTLPVSTVTGVTYNGVSMTHVNNTNVGSGDRTIYLYYLDNPPQGTYNIVASYNNSTNGSIAAASYKATTPGLDSSAVFTVTTANSRTLSTTVVKDNSWLVAVVENSANALVAETNAYLRSVNAGTNNFGLIDSNGVNAAGSRSMTVSFNGSNAANGGVIISIAPLLASPSYLKGRPRNRYDFSPISLG